MREVEKCVLIQVLKVIFLELLNNLKTKHNFFLVPLMTHATLGSRAPFTKVWKSIKSPCEWREQS
jgi:hypothetical protein